MLLLLTFLLLELTSRMKSTQKSNKTADWPLQSKSGFKALRATPNGPMKIQLHKCYSFLIFGRSTRFLKSIIDFFPRSTTLSHKIGLKSTLLSHNTKAIPAQQPTSSSFSITQKIPRQQAVSQLIRL
ncbi:hypothetical protein EDB82DRAFT_311951 [Fusarium venenatum]|uniref:uncharacterized protein n=1 Tax=Fusarium venenatum TaxID=56646 RepID=UPI001D213D64|nr:hypothetical protein EDB82DRAFT_311951 [Fusarium venenatum]